VTDASNGARQGEPGRLGGRAVLVTGAASGIGRAIALRAALDGAAVLCCDIREAPRDAALEADGDKATHELIGRSGGRAEFAECDVAEPASIDSAFARLSLVGQPWGYVLAAGIYTRDVSIVEETVDEHDRVMTINERGVWLGLRAAAQTLVAAGSGGRIVAVASISGLVGLADEPSYCASKGAVVNLVRAAALDLAPHQITVNAVCPGFVATAMLTAEMRDLQRKAALESRTPLRRVGTPADVAAGVSYLLSPDAGFVTGISLPIDGGYTCR
jgi:NAD(P)-dependent dehydrogenase (short-subunit alcohol dehydrogenase family)